MPKLNIRIALVALVATATLAVAEDWPKWMGPRGDNISMETTVADKWPADGPKRLWEKTVGAGHASPVAVEGKVYVFASGEGTDTLYAFDARTGEEIWKQTYDRRYSAQYGGTRATPTIEDGRIYTLGEAGHLTCREIADGKQVWQVNVIEDNRATPLRWGAASSPVIVGDQIYVQVGQGGPVAVAINKKDGKTVWKSQATGTSGYASITYADVERKPQLIVFGGKAIYGMNPKDGKTLWEQPWETDHDVNAATPIYRDGHVLISSEYNTAKGVLYKVEANGVSEVWENTDLKLKFQPPILDGDYIYANSSGTIVCVSWKDGKTQWEAKDRKLRIQPGGALLRFGGDKLLAMSERGRLSLVRATPEGIELLEQAQLLDGTTIWATPLLYDGKLYAKGMENFVCLDVSGK